MQNTGDDEDLLPHPFGERRYSSMQNIFQVKLLHQTFSLILYLISLYPVKFTDKCQVFKGCQIIIYIRIFRNITNPFFVIDMSICNILAKNFNLAMVPSN